MEELELRYLERIGQLETDMYKQFSMFATQQEQMLLCMEGMSEKIKELSSQLSTQKNSQKPKITNSQ